MQDTSQSGYSGLFSWRSLGESLGGLTAWDQRETEKRNEANSNQCSYLDGWHSCLQWISSNDHGHWICPPAELSLLPCLAQGAQLAVLTDLGSQPTSHNSHVTCPMILAKQGSKFAALPNCEYRLQLHTTRKPGQLQSPSYSPAWAGSQTSSPAQLLRTTSGLA